jgi:integrase
LNGKRSPQFDSHLARIRDHFGYMRALDVTAEMVDCYINEHKRQARPATVNRETQLLGQAFRLAVKPRHLNTIPEIQRLSEKDNARQGFVSRMELDRVIAHLPEYLQDVALFAYLSSWRRNEILSLRWDNIHGDTVRLRAEHSKEGEARSLALEGELADLIERRQSQKNGPLVFHHNGHAIVDLRKAWRTATRIAGISGKLLHDLRRSGVRDMIRAGVAPHVAMSISGHKTGSMLKRYAIISEADQRAALRKTQEFRTAEEISPAPATGKQLIQ